MNLADPFVHGGVFSGFESGKLSRSLLFAGPRMSGRLTTALELALHIDNRDESAALLDCTNIVYIPQRNLFVSVSSAYNLLKEKTSIKMRNHFVREIRKVLLQYHPALQEQGTDQKKDRLFDKAASIQEKLFDLIAAPEEDKKKLLSISEDIMEDVLSKDFLTKGRKKGGLMVDDVRLIQNYLRSAGERRFVIVENIEQAQDASKNALLKILEEPPENGYFFLISDNPQRILPTILSRVVKFTFPSPSKESLNAFLKEEFYCQREYDDLDEFFFRQAVEEKERETLEKYASDFHQMLFGLQKRDPDTLNSLFSFLEKSGGEEYFKKLVIKHLKSDMQTSRWPYHTVARMMSLMDDASESIGIFNQGLRNGYDLVLREASLVYKNS